MLKDISLVIDGRDGCGVGSAVQPGESLGVQLKIKCANEFHLPPAKVKKDGIWSATNWGKPTPYVAPKPKVKAGTYVTPKPTKSSGGGSS